MIGFFLSDATLVDHVNGYPVVADLYVYVTYQSAGGTVGKAWLRSVCNSDSSRDRRVSVNAHFGGDQTTGTVKMHTLLKNNNIIDNIMNSLSILRRLLMKLDTTWV